MLAHYTLDSMVDSSLFDAAVKANTAFAMLCNGEVLSFVRTHASWGQALVLACAERFTGPPMQWYQKLNSAYSMSDTETGQMRSKYNAFH